MIDDKATPPMEIPLVPPRWPRWLVGFGPLIFAMIFLQLWLSGRLDWSMAFVLALTDTLPWVVALPIVLWLAHRFPLDSGLRWRSGMLHAGAALVLSFLLPVATIWLLRTANLRPQPGAGPQRQSNSAQFGPAGAGQPQGATSAPRSGDERRFRPENPPRPGEDRGPPGLWRMAVMRMPFHWLTYTLLLMAMQGWRADQRGHARRRREAELERQLAEARLTGLARQLHPHFLFNTLNTIVEFVRSDPERAEDMLIDLSELLRHALRAAKRHVVPLAEELELLERYLSIQRARFGERLQIERQIDPRALSAEVPVLLLQPLVENAMEHGLDRSDAPVTVTIMAQPVGGQLSVSVRDDAPVAVVETAGEGIGLANTRQRLATLYGQDFQFSAARRSEGGFAVDFVLPFTVTNVSPASP